MLTLFHYSVPKKKKKDVEKICDQPAHLRRSHEVATSSQSPWNPIERFRAIELLFFM